MYIFFAAAVVAQQSKVEKALLLYLLWKNEARRKG